MGSKPTALSFQPNGTYGTFVPRYSSVGRVGVIDCGVDLSPLHAGPEQLEYVVNGIRGWQLRRTTGLLRWKSIDLSQEQSLENLGQFHLPVVYPPSPPKKKG